ncbi:cation diffusion facilitator family transporter [Yunchengibacter salinarum]|uniref:cation diffusion facilitator family transporter n=1 Tax=Yunchengibacter salinarum TaxID=3133399 RepID=UPI0035B69E79
MMNRQEQDRLMRLATFASTGTALSLIILKALVWWQSGSVAMLGSLADSSLDLAASLVTLFAVRAALIPADADHRFGHGKAEGLAGLFQAAVMSGLAVMLLLESLNQALDPVPVRASGLVMAVSGAAIVFSLALVTFQAHVVRRTGSIAIAGDHLHYRGDLLMNAGVIAAAWLSAEGVMMADGVIGSVIALYILNGARQVGMPAIDMLMDREFDDDERERIFNIVMANPAVRGLHDLRTRHAGRDSFIQMHVDVDGTMTVAEGHMIAGEVEATLSEAFPTAHVLIHLDPADAASDARTANDLLNDTPDSPLQPGGAGPSGGNEP